MSYKYFKLSVHLCLLSGIALYVLDICSLSVALAYIFVELILLTFITGKEDYTDECCDISKSIENREDDTNAPFSDL